MDMVKAYVLVVTDPGATKRVYDALAKVPGSKRSTK